MSLKNKLSIEPLTEARWGRVERTVFRAVENGLPLANPRADDNERRRENLPSVRWRSSTSLVLAGAAAAAIGAFSWRTIAQREQREVHAGPARFETAAAGSHVEVGESTVDVGPESSVRVVGDDAHGVIVMLDGGRVEVDVSPRHDRPPFIVQAGPVEVRVIGTHFVVTRAGTAVGVEVQRGTVEVISGDQHTFVAAGAHWPSLPEHAPPDARGAVSPSTIVPVTQKPVASSPGRAAAPPAPASHESYESPSKLESRALSQRELYE
ncbi:MAG: FecR family protein, partial [Myxococcota bacterium]|nr:FecR family protein [Myxococcota bacterium]